MDNSMDDSAETKNTNNLNETSRKILMPVDGSEHSKRAFDWYLENVMRPNDGLYLVHIIEPMSPGINYSLASKSLAMKEDFTRHISTLVESGRVLQTKFLSQCEAAGVAARFTIHIGTKPGEHIVRIATESSTNMVIIGSRGLGTVRRTFLGSVSDYILHNVNIPVVVVPPAKASKKK